MKEIKIVIGANFGDEGKGLMTDYFAHKALENNKKNIVVLSNGGAQRGHTVELKDGIRHVFHHFGSGVFRGAKTFCPGEYILNPLIFMDEILELNNLKFYPEIFISGECLVSTPFDMMINQIIEEYRGANKHGSCGIGIWETVVRNGLRVSELYNLGIDGIRKYLIEIRDNYLPKRLAELGLNIKDVSEKWINIINNESIIDNYIQDFWEMIKIANGFSSDEILLDYDTVIFENGQGLLLDWDMKCVYDEHVTASYTGLKNPHNILKRLSLANIRDIDIEVCYVSRTYMTRHGAGRLDGECPKEELNPLIEDKTNVPNPHQGTIRYGKLNTEELFKRTQEDFEKWKIDGSKLTRAITHINELSVDEGYIKNFDYYSKTATEVIQ